MLVSKILIVSGVTIRVEYYGNVQDQDTTIEHSHLLTTLTEYKNNKVAAGFFEGELICRSPPSKFLRWKILASSGPSNNAAVLPVKVLKTL